MTTKLALSIKEEIVKKAKRISRIRGKSVSKIIEEYFRPLPKKDESEETAVDKIKKIIRGKITNPNLDWKKAKEEHLMESQKLST